MGKSSKERALADNEAKATVRNIRVSPQKLNLVASSVRGMDCEKALATLQFNRRRVSDDIRKALQTAIANAENNHQLDVDRLFVKEITVGKSIVMKRWQARARGRVGKIIKPFANLYVIVSEREETA